MRTILPKVCNHSLKKDPESTKINNVINSELDEVTTERN